MAINRPSFKNSFRTTNIPDWKCPTCKTGHLHGEPKNFKTYESFHSSSHHDDDAWDPSWISGIFLGILKCNNLSCAEPIVLSGIMSVDEDYEYDQQNDSWDSVAYEYLTPTNFTPHLNFFEIDQDVPKEIRAAILDSFNLFWIDVSSCANKIRITVELIMDEMKIAKTYLDSKKKRKIYSLHKRIELFKIKNSNEAEQLMAIKWIGNSGSHKNDGLTKDDILDGYEILEHVTKKIFEKESERIKKLTKQINKRKKPLGNSRKKK